MQAHHASNELHTMYMIFLHSGCSRTVEQSTCLLYFTVAVTSHGGLVCRRIRACDAWPRTSVMVSSCTHSTMFHEIGHEN